jgi:hypothetical protein
MSGVVLRYVATAANVSPESRAGHHKVAPQEGETMNYKVALASLLLVTAAVAYADPEPCNLAVVSRELPAKTKVCDSQTVAALARQGHVYEQNQLGLAAMLVVGPNVDLKTAAEWFQKSAEHGYAPAQVNLAVLYVNGWGVSRNYAAAQLWLRRAADAHYAPAYFNLGQLYFKGIGVRQDYAEALRFFQLGVDAGDSYSQTNLAYIYDRGLGVAQDVNAAVRWYSKAADAGNAMAQSNLADLYSHGEGVTRDEAMAFRLFQKAAEQGHTGAQIQVAYRLAEGVGTSKDPRAALTWVTAAVSSGDNRGQELLHTLQLQLKPSEIKRSQQVAADLRQKSATTAKAALFQP